MPAERSPRDREPGKDSKRSAEAAEDVLRKRAVALVGRSGRLALESCTRAAAKVARNARVSNPTLVEAQLHAVVDSLYKQFLTALPEGAGSAAERMQELFQCLQSAALLLSPDEEESVARQAVKKCCLQGLRKAHDCGAAATAYVAELSELRRILGEGAAEPSILYADMVKALFGKRARNGFLQSVASWVGVLLLAASSAASLAASGEALGVAETAAAAAGEGLARSDEALREAWKSKDAARVAVEIASAAKREISGPHWTQTLFNAASSVGLVNSWVSLLLHGLI